MSVVAAASLSEPAVSVVTAAPLSEPAVSVVAAAPLSEPAVSVVWLRSSGQRPELARDPQNAWRVSRGEALLNSGTRCGGQVQPVACDGVLRGKNHGKF